MRIPLSVVLLVLVAGCAQPLPAPVTAPSGLVYQSLKEGSGTPPAATDTVKVHYRGTLMDGREFDSSYQRGEPAEFALNRVIRCWTEGVQMMRPGGKARLTCPPAIAYGERGAGGVIPPNATLQFEVELLSVR
jgi:FKBP-type peptidyl-prolyl cis-trans isomerase FkpA